MNCLSLSASASFFASASCSWAVIFSRSCFNASIKASSAFAFCSCSIVESSQDLPELETPSMPSSFSMNFSMTPCLFVWRWFFKSFSMSSIAFVATFVICVSSVWMFSKSFSRAVEVWVWISIDCGYLFAVSSSVFIYPRNVSIVLSNVAMSFWELDPPQSFRRSDSCLYCVPPINLVTESVILEIDESSLRNVSSLGDPVIRVMPRCISWRDVSTRSIDPRIGAPSLSL